MTGRQDGETNGVGTQLLMIAAKDLRTCATAEPAGLGILLVEADGLGGAGDLQVEAVLAAGATCETTSLPMAPPRVSTRQLSSVGASSQSGKQEPWMLSRRPISPARARALASRTIGWKR